MTALEPKKTVLKCDTEINRGGRKELHALHPPRQRLLPRRVTEMHTVPEDSSALRIPQEQPHSNTF